ncbi:MAG TPA: efflux RND transporter periplasmic adaptor subunit [Gemmatimonadales bacterium]|nr:efflux RND transporter periplasmic adaptor subunit [Gemmatimonadales bacterium]
MRVRSIIVAALAAAACKSPPPPPVYEAVPVDRRDVIVSVEAAGTIQPDTTVSVKSRASGEVEEVLVETGQRVEKGDLLVKIDPRIPRNSVQQAQADLDVAKASLENAETQKKRSDELYAAKAITQQEHDQSVLDYANAKANVVKSQVALENAKIALADANVRAPISGTIIVDSIERGTIITSATANVSGGTTILKMADLNLVQVNTLVDETDIGKIRPGMTATVMVDAYANRPFEGEVLKIEPQAVVDQNVTMFPVRVRVGNGSGLLRPGMNAEVSIHVGERHDVLAIPNAALRTTRDVGSAAQVLGLNPEKVQQELANMPDPQAPGSDSGRATLGARAGASTDSSAKPAGNTMAGPNGSTIKLPDGVTAEQVRAIFAKFRSGQSPTPAERQILSNIRRLNGGGRMGGRGGRGRAGGETGTGYEFGGDYIVFVLRNGQPTPVKVRTGLTDLEYAEVVAGLQPSDSVLLLPSASLVQSQQEFKERVNRFTGGGAVPGMKSNNSSNNSSSNRSSNSGGGSR